MLGHAYSECGTQIIKLKGETYTGGDPVIMRIYEAPDGVRGSWEEVLAHEQEHGFNGPDSAPEAQDSERGEAVLFRVYESELGDGYVGSLNEVEEHEKKGGYRKLEGAAEGTDEVLFKLYEAEDGGFRYENKHHA
jgi:hypothetical protein